MATTTNRAAAEATMERLFSAITTVKDPVEFSHVVTDALYAAFNEISTVAWHHALTRFADEMEKGMHAAAASGIPAQECGIEVTDVIMAARAMAEEAPQIAAPGGTP